MEYPLITEYSEAILSAEDNFNELSSLRPVLDDYGNPMMSSGNFAVVFKMRDVSDGKLYAVKCFIKNQEGRDESYRKIAAELEIVSSSYILPLRYLENELFVDTDHCQEEKFPVVVMEWVEGETLDAYLNRNLQDKYELEMLSYRFNRMAAWLLPQPFAHGDLKPDNILVRKDGSLVLVDYDGMFVPSMKGEKAREIGSQDYTHPTRTIDNFDEHIDDFSIPVIALSLKAIAINPKLKSYSSDSLLLNKKDYCLPSESISLKEIQKLTYNLELSQLMGIFYISLAVRSLDSVSFKLFTTDKPKPSQKNKFREIIDTTCSDNDIDEGIEDEVGVIYSRDGRRLLSCKHSITKYCIKKGTHVICDRAFHKCSFLQSVVIPNSVTTIGNNAFSWCSSLKAVTIPESVTTLGCDSFSYCSSLQSVAIPESIITIEEHVFSGCSSLQSVAIPKSVIAIGDFAFYGCSSLQSVAIPESVTTIGGFAFAECSSLQSVTMSESVTTIGDRAFSWCSSLQSIKIPVSVTVIDEGVFQACSSLQSIVIPESVSKISSFAFYECSSLQSVTIPDSVTVIGEGAFSKCPKLSLMLYSDKSFKLINDLLIDKSGKVISCLNNSEHISIHESVTVIGDSAFDGCSSLHSIVIPESVTTIGDNAFDGCSSLHSIAIPESVTTIGNDAFSKCISLKSIVIPETVTSIGKNAFPILCNVIKNSLSAAPTVVTK